MSAHGAKELLSCSTEELATSLKQAGDGIPVSEWQAPYAKFMLVKEAATQGKLSELFGPRDAGAQGEGYAIVGKPIERDVGSAFGSKAVTEISFSAKDGFGIKHTEPVNAGVGEELRTTFYKLG